MAENIFERSSTYNISGWVSFVLGIIVTPLFAILGIILGIIANRQSPGTGTTVIWANSLLLVVGLIVTLLFYGIAGLAFFTIIRSILGY